jgi:hypothetical protein
MAQRISRKLVDRHLIEKLPDFAIHGTSTAFLPHIRNGSYFGTAYLITEAARKLPEKEFTSRLRYSLLHALGHAISYAERKGGKPAILIYSGRGMEETRKESFAFPVGNVDVIDPSKAHLLRVRIKPYSRAINNAVGKIMQHFKRKYK